MNNNEDVRSLNDMVEIANKRGISRSEKILSNLEFINDKMDNVQKMVVKTNEVCNGKHLVNSNKEGNLLYSKMNVIVSDYYLAQKELMEKLNHEAKFVRFVGEKYYEMDKKLEKEIGRI